jgi:hypothetical protein
MPNARSPTSAQTFSGGDKVSRLYKMPRLRKARLPRDVSVYNYSTHSVSVFTIQVTAAPNHTLDELIEKEIDAQLENVPKAPRPRPRELDGTKLSIERSALFSTGVTLWCCGSHQLVTIHQ